MSQKLPVNDFEWIFSIYRRFHKKLWRKNGEWYFLKVDIQCPVKLRELYNVLPFLSKRINIEKVKKTCNMVKCMLFT